jgi:hypothetical protein
MYAWGTGVPADATVGYSPGCLFIDEDASAGAQLYINEGTNASCDFNLVSVAEGDQTESGTKTGGTIASATLTDPTISGTVTDSATGAYSGQNTFDDLIETDFNPYTRVWARADFTKKCAQHSSLSRFSTPKSFGSANFEWVVDGSGAYGVSASTNGANYLVPGSSKSSSTFCYLKPYLNSNFGRINWLSQKSPRFRAVIAPTDNDQSRVLVGLYSSYADPGKFDGGASGSHRVEVVLSSSDSVWKVHADMNGSDSSLDSASGAAGVITSVEGQATDIEIRFDSGRIPSVYINSTLVWTSARAMTTAKRLIPIIGVQLLKGSTITDAHANLGVFHVEMSQNQ